MLSMICHLHDYASTLKAAELLRYSTAYELIVHAGRTSEQRSHWYDRTQSRYHLRLASSSRSPLQWTRCHLRAASWGTCTFVRLPVHPAQCHTDFEGLDGVIYSTYNESSQSWRCPSPETEHQSRRQEAVVFTLDQKDKQWSDSER